MFHQLIRSGTLVGMLVCAFITGQAVNLQGAGATFPFPLYSKWFDVYQQKTGVQINYQSVGSGAGIKLLQAGTINFGASDAPLSKEEAAKMPGKTLTVPMVAGAVVVSYNLPGKKHTLKLDSATLGGIFLGEITQWNDTRLVKLNPTAKLPKLPIVVVHRSDGSGTSYLFTQYLASVHGTWKDKVGYGKSVNWPIGLGGKGNEGVAGLVKETPGAIGYVELAYAMQTKMAVATLKNAAGQYVTPSLKSTSAAAAASLKKVQTDIDASIINADGKDSYPIVGFTYIMLLQAQKGDQGEALIKFLRWAIHDGQGYAEPLLYAPLPKEIVKLDEALLQQITIDGKPVK